VTIADEVGIAIVYRRNTIFNMKTVTFKLPEKLDAELEATARAEGVSKSQIMRKAIEDRIGRKPNKKAPRAYDLAKDLCGSLKGPGDLSTNPKHMKGFGG
jgi:hypothetical protein